MTRIERTKLLPKLTLEIVDLKFIWIENNPYQTKLDANIFYQNYFSFQEKLIVKKN